MRMLREIAVEIIAMFIAEKWLSLGILAIVAAAAAVINLAGLGPLVAGAVLLFGCLGLLVESVCRHARARAPRFGPAPASQRRIDDAAARP